MFNKRLIMEKKNMKMNQWLIKEIWNMKQSGSKRQICLVFYTKILNLCSETFL